MKKIVSLVLCAALVWMLSGCDEMPAERTVTAMDTVMSIRVFGDDGTLDDITSLIHTLDASLSAVDEDSEIAALNRDKAALLSDDAAAVLSRTLDIAHRTDGALDPTVCPLMNAWGFLGGAYRVPSSEEIESLLPLVDASAVKMDGAAVSLPKGASVDLGAVAKGYLADRAKAILSDSAASGAVLNLGGTILTYGSKSDGSLWKVGVADPEHPTAYFGYLTCTDRVIATSGGYERYFEEDGRRYIHILDPSTGYPVDNHLLSVTVVADDGLYADALSTALFVMGIDGAAAYYDRYGDFDCIILCDDGTMYMTDGVSDIFALADGYEYTIQQL